MTGKHHLIAGTCAALCATTIAATYLNSADAIAILDAAVVAGSLLPDIDSRTSILGKKHPILSWIASKTCGHRGFCHSLLFVLVLSLPLILIGGWWRYVGIGLAIGMPCHLLCDMCTKMGVPLLHPFSSFAFRFTKRAKSGGKFEIVSLILVVVVEAAITIGIMRLIGAWV